MGGVPVGVAGGKELAQGDADLKKSEKVHKIERP